VITFSLKKLSNKIRFTKAGKFTFLLLSFFLKANFILCQQQVLLTVYRLYSEKESYQPNIQDSINKYKQDYFYYTGYFTLHYQLPLKNNSYLRPSISFSKSKTYNLFAENNSLTNLSKNSKFAYYSHNIALSFDYGKEYKTFQRLRVYYGTGLFSWCILPSKIVNINLEKDYQNQIIQTNHTSHSNTVIGLNLHNFVGLKYYITKNFFIGDEIRYVFSFGSLNSNNKKVVVETINLTTNQKTTSITKTTNAQKNNIGSFFDYVHITIGYNLKEKNK
jgi:hypothetical protein